MDVGSVVFIIIIITLFLYSAISVQWRFTIYNLQLQNLHALKYSKIMKIEVRAT